MPDLTPYLLIFAISTPSLLHLSADTHILMRADRASHVYITTFVARHALRPRMVMIVSADCRHNHCCFQVNGDPEPPLILVLSELNLFSLAAYGLQHPLPTLNPLRYHNRSKAKYEMRSVTLSRWRFQPLAVVHFRGAPILNLCFDQQLKLKWWVTDFFVNTDTNCMRQHLSCDTIG